MTVQYMVREEKRKENPSEICIGIEQPNLQERKKKQTLLAVHEIFIVRCS